MNTRTRIRLSLLAMILSSFCLLPFQAGATISAGKPAKQPTSPELAPDSDRILEILLERVPDLTPTEIDQLKEVTREEHGVEIELKRPSLTKNPEAVADLNSRIVDLGMQRIRILAGANANHFVQIRNNVSNALAHTDSSLRDLEEAVNPYRAGIRTGKKIWTSSLQKACAKFWDQSYYPAAVASQFLSSFEDVTLEKLAIFDTLLLEDIIQSRQTGRITDNPEIFVLLNEFEWIGPAVEGMAKQLRENTVRAGSWNKGDKCPTPAADSDASSQN